MSSVNGTVTTTIIVAGLALAAYAAADDRSGRPMGDSLLIALASSRSCCLSRWASLWPSSPAGRTRAIFPRSSGTCAHPIVPVAAALWGWQNGPAGARGCRRAGSSRHPHGRLHQLWPVIHV